MFPLDTKEKEQHLDTVMTNEEKINENGEVKNEVESSLSEILQSTVNQLKSHQCDVTLMDNDFQIANAKLQTPGRQKLRKWLNQNLRIKMTDGRILTGSFLCTDRDANVILGLCSEYLSENSEARALGLVMVPGRHIVTIHLDE